MSQGKISAFSSINNTAVLLMLENALIFP